VGVGIAAAVVVRRTRLGRAAAKEQVLEQREEPAAPVSVQDLAEDSGTDASDLADAADAVDGERG